MSEDEYLSNWEWFLSSDNNILYQRMPDAWLQYTTDRRRPRRRTFSFQRSTHSVIEAPITMTLSRVEVHTMTRFEISILPGFPNSAPTSPESILHPITCCLSDDPEPLHRHWTMSYLDRSDTIH